MGFWYTYVDKGSNSVLLLHEINKFKVKLIFFPEINFDHFN